MLKNVKTVISTECLFKFDLGLQIKKSSDCFLNIYFPNVRQTVIGFDSCVSGVNEKQAVMVRVDWPTPGSNYLMLSTGVSVLSDDILSICIGRSTSCYSREMVYQVCSVLINALIFPLKCRNLWYCNVWTQLYWSALKEGGKNEGIKERKREVSSAMVAPRLFFLKGAHNRSLEIKLTSQRERKRQNGHCCPINNVLMSH